jgi:hypothetical protein
LIAWAIIVVIVLRASLFLTGNSTLFFIAAVSLPARADGLLAGALVAFLFARIDCRNQSKANA